MLVTLDREVQQVKVWQILWSMPWRPEFRQELRVGPGSVWPGLNPPESVFSIRPRGTQAVSKALGKLCHC
jgi:hypothetical protein